MKRTDIQDWLDDVRAADGLAVTMMDRAKSTDWQLRGGALRHRTGRFFEVVGVAGAGFAQPMIAQPEIGTLGFAFRPGDGGLEVLVQAKVEPGNVGACQLAPSLQATASNIDRAHGGASPPGLALFAASGGRIVSDSLQSEQGSRFLGKSNRNLAKLFAEVTYESAAHRWMPVRSLLDVLHDDFLVNTDARSVLVCSPWEILAGGLPFATAPDPMAEQFVRSFRTPPVADRLSALKAELAALRAGADTPALCPLEDLPGCRIAPDGTIRAPSAGFLVRHIQVSSRSREVQHWDQPIIDSINESQAELHVVRIAGILHVGFRTTTEPGLSRKVELGPSRLVSLGVSPAADESPPADAVELVACRQSDEGGRFFHDVATYRLLDLGEREPDPTLHWLTLSEIALLTRESGIFTNEARTLLSLLLRHL